MLQLHREVFFLDSPRGRRFCVLTRPLYAPRGGLLYLHPFAEEMNKSRRMAALGALAFAESGWVVLQMDLFGCGDSEGGFGDAEWQDWLNDVTLGWACLESKCRAPLGLWTIRAGSLLAADWLVLQSMHVPLLLWHPATNGRQHLTQFLRLKAASDMLGESDAKAAMAESRAQFREGHSVEIAGYSLAPRMAEGLDAAVLRLPDGFSAPVEIIEVGKKERGASVVLANLSRSWSEAGVLLNLQVVSGTAFWQTQEIETVPGLIDASCQALERFTL